ncbi:MAG: hypothetical protein GC157_17135 [Frankiales bacterium]|nr:hypothetical protein [Frankiales bacterium]
MDVSGGLAQPTGHVLPDGTRIWLHDGRLFHRVDGPAVVHPDGTTEWWYLGWLHRADGPAIEGPDGRAEWWRHGRPLHPDGRPLDRDQIHVHDYSCLGPWGADDAGSSIDLRERRLVRSPARH